MTDRSRPTYRVGVDIGGTFTDVVFLGSNGDVLTRKVSSTPHDYSLGIIEGITQLLAVHDLEPGQIDEIVHGTTVATNAVLEKAGAKAALITTRGFRDVLELRRVRIPELYNMNWDKPEALIPRYLRLEVNERISAQGEILVPLEADGLAAIANLLESHAIEAVAVCLINSYANSIHERQVRDYLSAALPQVDVSISTDIVQEIKEFERTSTTVVNSYVQPVVRRYLQSLSTRLREAGITARLLVMQSNGAVMSVESAQERPCYLIESGPAAGAIGGAAVARDLGISRAITFDMGGTTAKAALIEGGEVALTDEYEVGSGMTIGSRLIKGDGYLLRIPAVDLAEVGAGGGSVAWVDNGGSLQVGPRSVGSVPGPACYGAGNEEATITDANVVLGYIGADGVAGGSLRLDPDLSWKALERLGRHFNMGPLEAARAVHVIGNARMSRAIRAVSTERGLDVRDFALIAFGGNGPVHAALMARDLGIKRVVVPPHAGLFSSIGMAVASVGHQYVQTFQSRLAELTADRLVHEMQGMQERALHDLVRIGYPDDQLRYSNAADLRYVGQSFCLTIDVPYHEPTGRSTLVAEIARQFHEAHARRYGHSSEENPLELVNLRLSVTVNDGQPSGNGHGGSTRRLNGNMTPGSTRDVHFADIAETLRTDVVSREDLREGLPGPLLVQEYDTTIVVPPGWRAWLDSTQDVIIESMDESHDL